MAKALVTWGGWDGHEPDKVAALCAGWLQQAGFTVEVTDTLSCFDDPAALSDLSLIVPVWTMSEISDAQAKNACAAVASGVGIAGCHGGMCDAFRANVDWQFMTGAQWVAHPGNDGRDYVVIITGRNEITDGLSDFPVRSEKYYMHVDPAIRVLATTTFEDYNDTLMPVTWTKTYGAGRVFYCSLGHHADIVAMPPVLSMMSRGMRWAAGEWGAAMGVPFAQAYRAG